MPLIQYPDIPNVEGVPDLVRDTAVSIVTEALDSLTDGLFSSLFGETVWGIYDSTGEAVLIGDSVVGFDFKNAANIPQHPIESGGFEAYNKVQTPFTCKVNIAIGTDEATRAAFLVECDTILKSTELYSVVTPEFTYNNCTLQVYNYRREARSGVTLLIVDLWFSEIRQATTTATDENDCTNTSSTDGTASTSTGQVQVTTATTSQAATIGSAK